MSLFKLHSARKIILGTPRPLISYIHLRYTYFFRIFTSLHGNSASECLISLRLARLFRRLTTSSKLFGDDENANGKKVLDRPEQGVIYSHKSSLGDNTIYEDSLQTFQEQSHVSDETFEPDSLAIEAFTHVHEQAFPKCPGCGVVFQSEDPAKSGFVIPAKNPMTVDLARMGMNATLSTRTLVCQKCFNLKYYNKPFPITISSNEIMDNLRHLRRRKGLILYVVDLLDLPGSLLTNLLDAVGESKRIIIVGNKTDMLPVDGHTGKQKEHLQEMLFAICKTHGLEGANVKSTCLVSAKTGFGMLQLVSKILEHWDHKGDIYLIGCSNTGKTSLFNLLLDLFSVYKKADLLQRATVSLWPCTTQSMLRFPVSHWMLKKLCARLREGVSKDLDDAEIEIDEEIIDKQETSYKVGQNVQRMRGRGRRKLVQSHLINKSSDVAIIQPSFVMDQLNKNQTWVYDTPGIISDKQISNLLTMDELKLLNPTLWLIPRTFILKPGQSLLLGGLGRVDYLEVKRRTLNNDEEWDTIPRAIKSVFFTVMTSPNLPVHVCKEPQADQVYEKHAGTELLGIPRGGKKRMETFPPFKSEEFTVKGLGWDICAADLVLSNLGWVAVTAGSGSLVSVRAHTPNGLGIDVREPAMLPTIVTRRGSRGVRYQGHLSTERYEATRKRNPQLIKVLRGQPVGEFQWVREIKRIRQEQRLLLKLEKRSRAADKKLLQRSAASDPPEISGAFGMPLPLDRKLKE